MQGVIQADAVSTMSRCTSVNRTRLNRARSVGAVFGIGLVLLSVPIAFVAPQAASAGVVKPVGGSASLAGVDHDADQGPADLGKDATYELPGAWDPQWTIAQLRQRFGKSNVKVAVIDGAEGETSRGVMLFDNDPQRRAEIFLDDPDHLHGMSSIRINGERSRWHLDNGVRIGMSLDALVALNGKPITFSGMDWDYGGGIMDWHGGKLAQRKGEHIVRSVSLSYSPGTPAGAYPMGDSQFRSDNRKYPRQGKSLHVGEIRVSFGIDD